MFKKCLEVVTYRPSNISPTHDRYAYKELVELPFQDDAESRVDLIFLKIREFMKKDWQLLIRSIRRAGNRVADLLARKGISSASFLEVCPDFSRALVCQEILGPQSPL